MSQVKTKPIRQKRKTKRRGAYQRKIYTCTQCHEVKPSWAFTTGGSNGTSKKDVCKDCETANKQNADLQTIPPEERCQQPRRALFINGTQDSYPGATIVGYCGELVWLLFDKPQSIGEYATSYVALTRPDHVFVGDGVEVYLESQREEIDRIVREAKAPCSRNR